METLSSLLLAARPRQWTKNLVCLAALIFSGKLSNPGSIIEAALGFLCFCFASSAVYIWNDVRDLEQDRLHPIKRDRPIASGTVPVPAALAEAILLMLASAAVALWLRPRFQWILALFVILNLLYSLGLKRLALIDVMAIGVGFVLRVQAGVEVIAAPQSAWIALCMFFMALLLGFGKRRAELSLSIERPDGAQRPVLSSYSIHFLDMLLGLSATTALVCYSIWAVSVQKNETFLLTILPVVFGIVRYMSLVILQKSGEDPDEVLATDRSLLWTVLIWTVLCVAVLYFGVNLFPEPSNPDRP